MDDYCELVVIYNSPTEGEHQDLIHLNFDRFFAVPQRNTDISLSGETVATPTPHLQPRYNRDYYVFGGDLGDVDDYKVTVANKGTAPLEFYQVTISDHQDVFTQTNNCTLLNPNEECEINVSFTVADKTRKDSELIFQTNDPKNPRYSLNLAGFYREPFCPPICSGDWVELDLEGEGNITINGQTSLSPVLARIDNMRVDLYYQEYDADLYINSTSFQPFPFSELLPIVAELKFELLDEIIGVTDSTEGIVNGQMKANALDVSANLFNIIRIPLGGGEYCRSESPIDLNWQINIEDSLQDGLLMSGTFEMPKLADCGAFTAFINRMLSGSENTMQLDFKTTNYERKRSY